MVSCNSHDYDIAIRCDLQRCMEPRDPSLDQHILSGYIKYMRKTYTIYIHKNEKFTMLQHENKKNFVLKCTTEVVLSPPTQHNMPVAFFPFLAKSTRHINMTYK